MGESFGVFGGVKNSKKPAVVCWTGISTISDSGLRIRACAS